MFDEGNMPLKKFLFSFVFFLRLVRYPLHETYHMGIRKVSDISCQLLFLHGGPHPQDGSIWHGLELLFLKGPKSTPPTDTGNLILKAFLGTASEMVPGSVTPSLNQNSIWHFIFVLHQISVQSEGSYL